MTDDPLAEARAIMQRQAREAGQPIIERWHDHASPDACGPQCPAGDAGWNGRGVVTDHFMPWDEGRRPGRAPR